LSAFGGHTGALSIQDYPEVFQVYIELVQTEETCSPFSQSPKLLAHCVY